MAAAVGTIHHLMIVQTLTEIDADNSVIVA